jgi:hypothetical protein
MDIRLKRAYELAAPSDDHRVLIDSRSSGGATSKSFGVNATG